MEGQKRLDKILLSISEGEPVSVVTIRTRRVSMAKYFSTTEVLFTTFGYPSLDYGTHGSRAGRSVKWPPAKFLEVLA